MRGATSKVLIGFLMVFSIVSYCSAEETSSTTPATLERKIIPPARRELKGKKFQSSLGEIYLPENFDSSAKQVNLLIHFHGASWLVEQKLEEAQLKCVLLTVSPGGFSSAYSRLFKDPKRFQQLLSEVLEILKSNSVIPKDAQWNKIGLSGFSAGYGAIREILSRPEDYKLINFVALADGIHCGFENPAKRTVVPAQLESFRKLAIDAVDGKKIFVLSHSSIKPPTYASTTETINYLVESVGGKFDMLPTPQRDERGMELIRKFEKNGLHIWGYSGETAADHMDHFYNIDRLFKYFK